MAFDRCGMRVAESRRGSGQQTPEREEGRAMSTKLMLGLIAVAIAASGFGCGDNTWADGVGGGGDGDGDGDGDGGVGCEPRCGAGCCASGETCIADECLVPGGSCAQDDDCQDDSCCAEGVCVPFGSAACGASDPECLELSPAGLFRPALQCAWLGPPAGDPFPNHVQVLGSPTVVNFGLGGDPDAVHPSIVFNSYDGLDGGSGASTAQSGVIRIIDGQTCEQQFSIGPLTNGCNPVALGDLDGDGRPEVVAYMADGGIEAFRYDAAAGTFVRSWEGHTAAGARHLVSRGYYAWTGPSIADLDDDGVAEVIAEGTVFDATGLLLDATAAATSDFSVVADVDLDGVVELVTGASVYGWSASARAFVLETTGGVGGYTAVADFGTYPGGGAPSDRATLDGIAEVAVVYAGSARVETLSGEAVFGPISLPSSTGGGPPTIGDFDGDDLPELAAAGSDSYTIFDPDCQGAPEAARCASLRTDGILWTRPSQDHSSNITGSSIFDFEGDGRAEAVYADEAFVRIYDGLTGDVLYSTYRSSCTWNENPIVADVDGDLNAELVVPSNENCGISPVSLGGRAYDVDPLGRTLDPLFAGLRCEGPEDCLSGVCDAGLCRCSADTDCGMGEGIDGFVCAPPPAGTPGETGLSTCRAAWSGRMHGIRVYRDALDRWASSRTIWNQHAYAVTHVLENGSVARTSDWDQNWTVPGLNNFRQNSQGEGQFGAVADMTSRGASAACTSGGQSELSVTVCNRGAAPVGAGLPVTFYAGDPADCQPIAGCVVATDRTLAPGECVDVGCLWETPGAAAIDVHVVADDDGTCSASVGERECHEGNNSTVLPGVACTGLN
jgi:hypothetical protein